MPSVTTSVAVPDAMREMLSRAQCIVFDLDGPIARVFAGEPAAVIARELWEIAERDGCLVEELRGCLDPMALLYGHTAEMRRNNGGGGWAETVAKMHDQLDAYERKAAESATPTPGAAAFIEACHASGRTLSIATNNHVDAATRILARMSVRHCFEGPVVGRGRDALLMKPHPAPLREAMLRGVAVDRHLMIGDTGTDFRAAQEVGMPFYGYHRSERGRRRLREAGVPLIASGMAEFLPFA
ncbi:MULTISPECIES: HAD family hydrolase [unclassified Streptomyces]|uniref:HAD family hydrolase n=1 Tax=unclassified Streptomyces TaxID=2593676 RepID=UPI0027881879|nr:HAD hydrolase-like protein [Streptomyces sp. V1I6]MDQ0843658.1 phosphoglycolate phosphatase [Streptomyces sp. V1I6]